MNDKEKAVISANYNFYRSFSAADYKTMETLWADRDDISIIHPGWGALHGRKVILSSWESMLRDSAPINIKPANEKAYITGDTAYVVCTEILDEAELMATNIFTIEEGEWKLLHHHAGLFAVSGRNKTVTH